MKIQKKNVGGVGGGQFGEGGVQVGGRGQGGCE